jgi:nitroreductase
MEFYDVVEKRRTIRDFTDQPVDREVVERILSAGMKAPSNDHLRNWEFVVVTDRDLIQTLLKKIPKQISEKRVDFIIKSW